MAKTFVPALHTSHSLDFSSLHLLFCYPNNNLPLLNAIKLKNKQRKTKLQQFFLLFSSSFLKNNLTKKNSSRAIVTLSPSQQVVL